MKRRIAILFAPLLLGGCLHLGARPLEFTCGSMLAKHSVTYTSTPLFAELQRDAGDDECLTGPSNQIGCRVTPDKSFDTEALTRIDPLIAAFEKRRPSGPAFAGQPAQPEFSVLMLSGGGSWGAFGAGYLQALGRTDWSAVTGISTGALQGLYVAAGDYDALAIAYDIKDAQRLAREDGYFGVVRKGAENDISPLRDMVMAYLVPANGAESPLVRMLQPGHPNLSIGMVEARSGDLKAVDVTKLVRDEFGTDQRPDPATLQRVAHCVAGIALASSSIPVRLTPVRIDGTTYVDGGVRSSVFEAGVARRAASYASKFALRDAPHIHVMRNGPTVVFRDIEDKDRRGVAEVDARPDARRVGMRGYSTLVNQNELMSIASLRLNYPMGRISVISADGFNAPDAAPASQPRRPGGEKRPLQCGTRPAELFNAKFMHCLIDWGRWKARHGPDWIELDTLAARAAAVEKANAAPY